MVDFVSHPVTVCVPASSANLGAGFDSMGLALALYDHVRARVVDGPTTVRVSGESAQQLPRDESHLIVRSMCAAFAAAGIDPPDVELECRNEIPHARGLGSSSAAIVAGILIADALVDDHMMDESEILALASQLEGHPDNVAPCLLGGFTVAWMDGSRARAVTREPAASLSPVVYIPDHYGLTEQARAVMPELVALSDAVYNLSRAALGVLAFTHDTDLLFDATDDRLHQRHRAPTMPESVQLVKRLRRDSIPAMVSGAGPSVLAFTQDPPSQQHFRARTLNVGAAACQIRDTGPQVLPST